VGSAVAKAIAEGYSKNSGPFHGYYFKILKGQGPEAPFGRLDYVIDGAMIGGFAMVAWPAEYGVTGVNTFMVSHDGSIPYCSSSPAAAPPLPDRASEASRGASHRERRSRRR